MFVDLTLPISKKHRLLEWAKSQPHPSLAMGHVGTHLDTYEKKPIPLEYFKSVGVIYDLRHIAEVKPNHLDLDSVPPKSFVFFRTGHMEQHDYGQPEYFHHHPQLSHDVINQLCAKKIRFIGVDCPGIRQGSEHEPADRLCEEHHIYVIENLINLEKISKNQFVVYTLWLDDETMTGLPCRVIAEV